MSTYEFVMKQRALSSESAISKKNTNKLNPTETTKTRYFSTLKDTFAETFRTRNKIQTTQEEQKSNKESSGHEHKQLSNGMHSSGQLPTQENKQEQMISTITITNNGIPDSDKIVKT